MGTPSFIVRKSFLTFLNYQFHEREASFTSETDENSSGLLLISINIRINACRHTQFSSAEYVTQT